MNDEQINYYIKKYEDLLVSENKFDPLIVNAIKAYNISKDQQIKYLTELYELARHMVTGYTIYSAEKHDQLLKSYQRKYLTK